LVTQELVVRARLVHISFSSAPLENSGGAENVAEKSSSSSSFIEPHAVRHHQQSWAKNSFQGILIIYRLYKAKTTYNGERRYGCLAQLEIASVAAALAGAPT
jgi:hypothetical protein